MSASDSRKQRKAEEKAHRKVQRETPLLELDYHPNALAYQGPIINTDLTITDSQKEALIQAGKPVPPPVRCRFLIDTGADRSLVGHEFAERAGLKLINPNTPLGGIGVDSTGRTYLGRIIFMIPSRTTVGFMYGLNVDIQISSGTLRPEVAQRIDGIIGREVLQFFEVTYNGMTGKVTLKFLHARKS